MRGKLWSRAHGHEFQTFSVYDWSNGAAAEAYNRMLDHFGGELVHRQ
jgi:hypothetical protein